MDDLRRISADKNPEVIYFADDITLPQLLVVPEMASFKLFFWQKTILNFSEYVDQKFELRMIDDQVNELSREIRDLYIKLPVTEIFNPETIDTSIKQIEYYWVSGYFKSDEVAIQLCESLKRLVSHLQQQAEVGYKFKPNKQGVLPKGNEGNYKLYYNEVIFSDTSILVRLEKSQITYLTNNGIKYMTSTDSRFFNSTYDSVQHLLKKSTLLTTSEKERNRVFNTYQKKIDQLLVRLSK